ncbi:MAG: acyl carrier protein [Pseudomonas sp.]|uniref:acyl carrier protein n=1 Tax=unclassified Pseudomonas TaxID=196821 RepID=UPI001CFA5E7E|nr:acyl carrier protein [Pseudomonas sp. L5B5]UCZ82215.1 acyl carrier protein [Pseudomonas sp. L5B5]
MSNFISNLLSTLSFSEKKQAPVELNEENIKHWLVQRMGTLLKIDPSQVDTARTFEAYGLDSLVAVKVAGDLEKFMEQRLSPALLFEYSSIDDLSKYLASELTTSEV